jgi:hypothetical protein
MMDNTTFEQKRELNDEQKRILGDRTRHLIGMESHEDACEALFALEEKFPGIQLDVVDVKTFYTVKMVGDYHLPYNELAAWIQGYMEGREAVEEEIYHDCRWWNDL